MKLSDIKNAYCVGIKGTGVSAVALLLASRGVRVTGSDTEEYFFSQESLKKAGIAFFEGISAEHITGSEDVVVYSTAYAPEKNPELAEAKQRGIPLLSYSEFLGIFMRDKLSLAVCGSHGKTTITAMLAHTLVACNVDPSAIVGSSVSDWGGGSLAGKGNYFVFEADEYQNKFDQYFPWSVILTGIDWDHPDFFVDELVYREVFTQFLKKTPPHGHILVCADDAEALLSARESGKRFLTYGFSTEARDEGFTIYDVRCANDLSQTFTVKQGGVILGEFEIQLSGKHNVQNAGAVVAMCHILKCNMDQVAQGLATFRGTARRFEKVGERDGTLLYDDYGHHPTEIEATLKGARRAFPHKRILAVFQPHTFSRTKALFEKFAQCFGASDKVYLLDIYASARETASSQDADITSETLVDRINRYTPGRAVYAGSIDKVVALLQKEIQPNDLVLTIGAGNVWEVAEKLK